MTRPGWVRGRMQPPRWYSTPQEHWTREDWRLAKKAGEVSTTPYDPPPVQELGNAPVIPPPGPQPSFSPFSKPRGREVRGAQSRAVDALIEKALGPR